MTKERIEEIAVKIRDDWSAGNASPASSIIKTLSALPEFQEQPKPAPMDRKRVEEIAKEAIRRFQQTEITDGADLKAVADDLAPLLGVEEPWVKIEKAARMPDFTQPIEFVANGIVFPGAVYDEDGHTGWFGMGSNCSMARFSTNEITHWRNRHIPAPPVEEESELVKMLRVEMGARTPEETIKNVVEIIKRHEAKAGKK